MANLVYLLRSTALLLFYAPLLKGSDVKRTYKLGFLVPFNKGMPCKDYVSYYADEYAPAIPVAMEKVNSLNYNFSLTWVWNDTMCQESLAIKQQIWQLNNGVDVFFGPVQGCACTSKTAVAFNKPVMSFKCNDPSLADKKIYKTVARTSISSVHLMPPLLATLKHFNWKRVAIVHQKTDRWIKINDYVSKILKLPNNNITIGIEDSVEYSPRKLFTMDFEHLRVSVTKIKQKARIVILLMAQEMTIEYMLQAYEEGLVQTGEYVFIAFHLDPHLLVHKFPFKWYYSSYHGHGNMQKTIDSFAAALILQVRPITGPSGKIEPKYLDFATKVREKSRELPFKTNIYSGCLWENGENECNETGCRCMFQKNASHVPIEAAHLYHAVLQYAYALNKTLANNMEPNGTSIINALKGHTFDSIFGFQIAFDNQADVMFNMTLLHQEYVNGSKEKTNCEPFLAHSPCRVMKTIGEFWLNKKNISEQIYHVVKKKMTWYGGRTGIPPDTPKCGFDNELCQEPPKFDDISTKILGSVCGVLALLVVLLLLYIIHRKTSICHSVTSIFRAPRMSNKNEDYDHFCGDTVNDVQEI